MRQEAIEMRHWGRIAGCAVLAAALLVFAACTLFTGTKAKIEIDVIGGVVPLTIAYSAAESTGPGGISTYRWSFGTGDELYEATGTYTYQHAGTFTLTLTVRASDGSTATATRQITIEPAVWIVDENLNRIYKLDMTGAELLSFPVSVQQPRGIAVAEIEGQARLMVACYGGGNQRILRIDPVTGATLSNAPAPAGDPLDLTYAAAAPVRIWHIDGLSRRIYEMNPASLQVFGWFGVNYFRASQQVGNVPFLYLPQGLAWRPGSIGAGALLYVEGETRTLYTIDIVPSYDIMSDTQLEIVQAPVAIGADVFPVRGADWYDGGLWVADGFRRRIVEIDPTTGAATGRQISGFPGAGISGVAIQR